MRGLLRLQATGRCVDFSVSQPQEEGKICVGSDVSRPSRRKGWKQRYKEGFEMLHVQSILSRVRG